MQLRLPLLQCLQMLLPAFILLTPVGSAAGTAGGSFNSAFVRKPPCCYVPPLFSVRCLSLARHRHRLQRAPNTASTRRVTGERPCGRGPWLLASSPVGQQRKTSNPSRSRSSVGSTRPMGLGGDGRRINLMQKEKKTSQELADMIPAEINVAAEDPALASDYPSSTQERNRRVFQDYYFAPCLD